MYNADAHQADLLLREIALDELIGLINGTRAGVVSDAEKWEALVACDFITPRENLDGVYGFGTFAPGDQNVTGYGQRLLEPEAADYLPLAAIGNDRNVTLLNLSKSRHLFVKTGVVAAGHPPGAEVDVVLSAGAGSFDPGPAIEIRLSALVSGVPEEEAPAEDVPADDS